jgi:hypothetical protein
MQRATPLSQALAIVVALWTAPAKAITVTQNVRSTMKAAFRRL